MKIKLSKLVFKTKGGKETELSHEEAKELYAALDELFGVKEVPHFIDRYVDRHRNPLRPYWDVWYGSSSEGLTANTSTLKSITAINEIP